MAAWAAWAGSAANTRPESAATAPAAFARVCVVPYIVDVPSTVVRDSLWVCASAVEPYDTDRARRDGELVHGGLAGEEFGAGVSSATTASASVWLITKR